MFNLKKSNKKILKVSLKQKSSLIELQNDEKLKSPYFSSKKQPEILKSFHRQDTFSSMSKEKRTQDNISSLKSTLKKNVDGTSLSSLKNCINKFNSIGNTKKVVPYSAVSKYFTKKSDSKNILVINEEEQIRKLNSDSQRNLIDNSSKFIKEIFEATTPKSKIKKSPHHLKAVSAITKINFKNGK